MASRDIQLAISEHGLSALSISGAIIGVCELMFIDWRGGLSLLWMSGCVGWCSREIGLSHPALREFGAHASQVGLSGTNPLLVSIPPTIDPIHRELLDLSVGRITDELCRLIQGRAEFVGTESWRTAYERLLRSPDVTTYRSAAWVKSEDYWQDLPGERSLQLNYECLDRGVRIERILILGWNLWPAGSTTTLPGVRKWIEEQHYRGIEISLIHESDLLNEPDLLHDFGIYGERATGEQELDDQSRTVRFTLRFDAQGIRVAKDRWERLKLFAIPYAQLLDQA